VEAVGAGAAVENEAGPASSADQFVTMKKSKKFIKFKDFIIKLPNS